MPEIVINWWAVLGAAVVNFVIGWLWYGPLFGKQWKELIGFSEMKMQEMQVKMPMGKAITGGFVTAFLMSLVLAHDAFVWGNFFGASVQGVSFALQLAFWIWLGYVATVQVGSVLWEGRSWKLFFFNTAHSLVSLIAMALVLTYWK